MEILPNSFDELKKEDIDTELLHISGRRIQEYTACRKCFDNKNKQCITKDDIVNDCIEKMIRATFKYLITFFLSVHRWL